MMALTAALHNSYYCIANVDQVEVGGPKNIVEEEDHYSRNAE